ncbi:uncharacterized protein LOC131884440 isoform X2 [Tigriopus californicus]|nr:uncharacterized protein LOC131884440 isoform X2 [Tigriopus californicus]
MRSFVFLGLAIAAVSAEAQYGSHGAPSEKMDDKMMYGHEMPHMEYQEPVYARPHEYQQYREPHYMPHMEHGYERRQYGYQKPKYTTPKPAYHQPEPAYKHPERAYGHPEPAYGHPEPAYNHPKPAYKHPEPAYEHPEPKHEPAYPKPSYGEDSRNYHYQSYHMPGYNHHMFQEPDTQTYMNHMTYHDHKSYDHMPHTKQNGYRPEPSYTTPRPYHPTTYKPTPEPYKPTPRHYGPTPKPYRPTPEPYGPTAKPYAPTHAPYNHYRPTPSPYHTTTYRPYQAQSKSYEYEMPEPYMPYEEEKPARPAYHANAYASTTPKYAKEMMMDDHMEKETGVAPYSPPKSPAKPEPQYLGKFQHPTHKVEGDIFKLDDHTLYIQGFSFDGGAPDVVFFSDGVAIPYYTRSNPQMTVNVKKFDKEDVVLMLPPEKPTLKDLQHFQVWCRQFEQDFGEFVMN